MTPDTKNPDIITQKLQAAIDQLHRDVRRVEIWAGALCGFAQAVPTYPANNDFLLKRDDDGSKRRARRA